MFYKPTHFDYIPTEDNELVVFDPESGDTHFLNETATTVFNLLEQYPKIEDLVEILSKEYEAEPAEIEENVREIIAELLEKGILKIEQ